MKGALHDVCKEWAEFSRVSEVAGWSIIALLNLYGWSIIAISDGLSLMRTDLAYSTAYKPNLDYGGA